MAAQGDYTQATTGLMQATTAVNAVGIAPAVGGVAGLLQVIEVDDATIKAIVSILDSGVAGLDTPFDNVPPGAFGGSQSGSELAHHTELAHAKVRQAMHDMMTGLNGYRQGIETYVASFANADEASASASSTLLSTVEAYQPCLTAPDVSTNNSCAAPKEDG
ncbi:hypothetical protein LRP67_16585 [Nocardioides sp. cx-169]|uniref:hypothetical protein n=1 Tax=Nocardioides sp. cx-169 TaxID=2899080 RepID=UPI001E35C67E|nr:hypothetical protein [Nocardioides sp. cx-169]MCD4535709.1 hypothetical protein [Nocardioides sp. cx-169]